MGKLADLLRHPDEIIPMLGMAVAAQKAKRLPQDPSLEAGAGTVAMCKDGVHQMLCGQAFYMSDSDVQTIAGVVCTQLGFGAPTMVL